MDGLTTSGSLEVKSHFCQAPYSSVWSIQGSVGATAAGADESNTEYFTLGYPRDYVRYFAIVRARPPWLCPRQGQSKFELSPAEGGLLVSFLRSDGMHVAFLAVSGLDNVLALLHSNEHDALVVSAKNDNERDAAFHVIASAAPTFDLAVAAVMYQARSMVEAGVRTLEPTSESSSSSTAADDGLKSCWLDGLTYCTWNGLGQHLTADKIYGALESLCSHGIHIANLIIDDNWQSLSEKARWPHRREWTRMEASPDEFPEGLKGTVTKIRQKHRHIENVAVWHALCGYWGGISEDGELGQTYKTKWVKTVPEQKHDFLDGTLLLLDPDDVHRFYDDFYAFLSDAGITAVKADAQYYLDCLAHPDDRRRFCGSYQDAWAKATAKHLGGRAISCMSEAPQIIFHSQLPTNRPHHVLRTSQDFFPEIPSSHAWHIFCNAHIAPLASYLNVTPDWDMFQSQHDFAAYHAAARCLSGGILCLTDEPGRHDYALIRQITARTIRGRTIALRPDVQGTASNVYNDYDNSTGVLAIGTSHDGAGSRTGLLGLFNIRHSDDGGDDDNTVSTLVSLQDFPGVTRDGGDYIIRSFRSGRVSRVLSLRHDDKSPAVVATTLPPREWDIFSAHPTTWLLPNTSVSVLGLVDKMTGVAAVTRSAVRLMPAAAERTTTHTTAQRRTIADVSQHISVTITLRALGTVGVYISDFDDAGRTVGGNLLVLLEGRVVSRRAVRVDGKVVMVDVGAAWDGFGAGLGSKEDKKEGEDTEEEEMDPAAVTAAARGEEVELKIVVVI